MGRAQARIGLIQFAAGQVAEPRTSAMKIVRRELLNSARDAPSRADLRSHSDAPHFTSLVDRSKERAFGDATCLLPPIDRRLDPRWNGNGTNVPSLVREIGDDPVLLSQLDRIDAGSEQPAAAKSASDQPGEEASATAAGLEARSSHTPFWCIMVL